MVDASSTSSGASPSLVLGGQEKWISLVAEVPYFAIVVIGIVGVSWTNMLGVSVATYRVTMTPIAALLCVCVGWAHLPRGRNRLEMAAIQFGQWAAVLVAMYLIHVSNADGLVTHDALGSILLTLLALGVFISGLDLRTWKLCVGRRLSRACGAVCRLGRRRWAIHVSHRDRADCTWIARLVGGPSLASARVTKSPPRSPLAAVLFPQSPAC